MAGITSPTGIECGAFFAGAATEILGAEILGAGRAEDSPTEVVRAPRLLGAWSEPGELRGLEDGAGPVEEATPGVAGPCPRADTGGRDPLGRGAG